MNTYRAVIGFTMSMMVTVVTSCAQLPPPKVTHIGSGDAQSTRSSQISAPPSGPMEMFAVQVAKQRLVGPMDSIVSNWRLRGLYAGRIGDCDSVMIENLTLRHSQHYRVCGGQVIPFTGVAPSFPNDSEAQWVLSSVSRAGYLNGTASQQWGAYMIQARTAGPIRADRCANVQTTVTYEGMLVDQRNELICN